MFRCNDCGASYKDRFALNIHLKLCSTNYSAKRKLARLLLTFDEGKSYLCQICGTGYFKPKAMIEHHITTHSEHELWRWSIRLKKLMTLANDPKLNKEDD